MKREFWRYFDFWLFGAVLVLCVFGIAMIQSAIAGNAQLAGLPRSQTIYVVIGLAIVIIMAMIDYHYFASLSRMLYIFTILFLIVIFIIGEVQFGSARRIEVGSINIQPSELAKIVLIIVLSDYFARTQNKPRDLRWIVSGFLLTMGIVVWILLQPNLSTSIVIMVIWFSLLWISGLPPKYLLIFAGVGLLAAMAAFPFLEAYQQERIINFFFQDPNARHGNVFNVEQAIITIGSGGWFGEGYGHSTQVQLRYLKVRHTDFIFSAIAAEFGFVGTVVVMALLVFVILRCVRIARRAADPFGSYIAFGFSALLFFQMAVNIGVNLNLIPVTGLTLPFVSYGGSSLLSLVLGIGLVESVAARQKPKD
ncbi:MAG TPA: FtsW/RodA/SpoVE family cell cycle protein [Anaerolineaceae bacterium]|nr:FtsW/RodA/SpoVE family cell cycle protein [Anaerolineaceae bacterium]